MLRRFIVLLMPGMLLCGSVSAQPLIARFQSVLGDFDVLLDPVAAPVSVENFASYANRAAYDSTIIHRSTTGNPFGIQIVQGGGFELVGNTLTPVATDPPIALEAVLPNARGTIAMARTAEPDSATSQWYFNVTDNPGLNFNYAVFGRALGGGTSVIDAIGAVDAYDASSFLGPTFTELPLFAPLLETQNLVLISSVRVEPFAITNFTRTDNTTEVRWTQLSTNTPVRVERSADMAGPWTTMASNLTTGVFTDTSPPSDRAFYRVVTE